MADPISWGLVIAVGSAVIGSIANAKAADAEFEATQRQNLLDKDQLEAEKKDAAKLNFAKASEQSLANAYDVSIAAQSAELSTGQQKAKLGYSGVRGASPLLALVQQERFADEQVKEQARRGDVTIKNMLLESSLLTEDYQRKIKRLQDDIDYNNQLKPTLDKIAFAQGLARVGAAAAPFL